MINDQDTIGLSGFTPNGVPKATSDGILPENWKITTIGAISSLVTRGIAPKYDDSSDQIVLNQKCIRDHTIDISLSRRHLPKKINEKWISKGDLLINSTGTGTLGRVAQVWFEANNMTVDSHVLKKSKSIDWLKLNVSLAKRFFGKQGRWAMLESIAAPGTMTWRINGVGPESIVHSSGVLDVAQVE